MVHIGAERTGSDSIHRGLFSNEELLASHGVLVPRAGRHELSPHATRHHLLPWSLDPGDHPQDPRVWDELASEIRRSDARTVLISSELLGRLAAGPETSSALLDRLSGLSDDVTVVYFVREQLSLLNDLYGHGVKTFRLTCDFDSYVDQRVDDRLADLSQLRAWYDDGPVRFVAVPWNPADGQDAFAALLAAAGIDIETGLLASPPETYGEDLGPVGIEAIRLLGAYLRGRLPDFRPGEPAARKLRRRASTTALAHGWCAEDFWGWTPRSAAEAAARYADGNQEFARRTSGADWSLPSPLDRPRSAAELIELDPQTVTQVHRFVTDMERVFRRLRAKQEAA